MTGPGRWLTIASRGFSNYVSGHPLCVSFEITHACNASCDHCHRGGPVEENQATPEELARIFQELRPSVIQVSGGKPLLRNDVKEVILALQHPDGSPLTILVTNGSLLTPDLFRELHSLGVDAYSLSLDYPDDRHESLSRDPHPLQPPLGADRLSHSRRAVLGHAELRHSKPELQRPGSSGGIGCGLGRLHELQPLHLDENR